MDAIYTSSINRDVKPAARGEFASVQIGPIGVDPPVVLAPMAGITNAPFRKLCRRFGAGLYVSEMITARALVERNEKTMRLAGFEANESPRSLQLYGVDPHYVGEAVKLLVDEDRVDHIDMNFGCPVRKVTRRGGGAAIPAKPRLLESIVRAAVRNAGRVPITIKFRMGIDDDWLTFLDAGRIAETEGCRAVALHARTAAQLYDGDANWNAIGRLKQAVTSIPVFGNGDIWEAWDALRMMRATGCDGVVVGRGCLGRPWLFRDLADVFAGREPSNPPDFGAVMETMREHAQLLCSWVGERIGIRDFRKHATWYTKGFPGSTKLRDKLIRIESLSQLDTILAEGDPELLFPPRAMRVKRGKKNGRQRVMLPKGFRENLEDTTPPAAEEAADGG
ncbi:MAG: tRNA dihydrouridine synthase DusB [Deltaproteobacteria bacterium]|nr:tRNA dihydrouridine synthase DusB [Deltaproteobacteria bacterium]